MELDDKNINTSSDLNVFTKKTHQMSKATFLLKNILEFILKVVYWLVDLILSMFKSLWNFFKTIGIYCGKGVIIIYKFIKKKCHQFLYNDWSGRLSYIVFGASSFKHGQIVNGILYLLFEIGYIACFCLFGVSSISKLGTLGTVANGDTGSTGGDGFDELGGGDNSILILIFGLLWTLSLLIFIYIWLRSINSGYANNRIQKFNDFKNVIDGNKEYSAKLNSDVVEAYSNGIKKGQFKKEHKDEILEYLNTKNSNFDKKYSKYLVYETIDKAYEQCKNEAKQIKVINKLEEKRNKTVEKYNANLVAFSNKQEIKLVEYRAKLNEKANSETDEIKAEILKETQSKQLEDYLDKQEGKLESFKGSNDSKIRKIDSNIKKAKHKLGEIKKCYTPFAYTQETINNSKYGKFNVYHIKVADYQSEIKFLENYQEFYDVYKSKIGTNEEQNKYNANKIIEIKEQSALKIKEINSKFDAIEEKRKSINSQIKELALKYKTDRKALVASGTLEEIEDFDVNYIHENTVLNNSLNELPSAKNSSAMRKEEIKEVTHAAKRDIKYLKTNFKEAEYCLQNLKDYMMINYKFTYKQVNQYSNYMGLSLSNDEVVSKRSIDDANLRLEKLISERDEYIAAHTENYEGKSKTFVEQIKSLFNEKFHITILALPITGIALFTIVPLIFSILVAFTNYSLGHVPPTQLFTWNGIENFINLFNAPADSALAILPTALSKTVVWTLLWALIATFSNYILGIIVALMINKKGIKLKKMWRTIFVLTIAIPQFISLMSIGVLLKDEGAIGQLFLSLFGHKLGFGTNSTNNAIVSKVIIILVNIWVGIPYTILSTTGILMNIPEDLYESAKVDGAGTVTQFLKITMPYILFVTGPYLITQFIGNINNFNVIYFLTGGGPSYPGSALAGLGYTDLLITFLYKLVTNTSNPQYGIASAVGIVIFVICSFISIVMYNKSGSVQEEDQFQ